ncbi:hypothetical protein EJ070_31695 [Mesorhizobium sp. M1E.F.Ca.ET.045.02.1.1]|uniref:hypothetical protein n=1 Tax=Mesorhizobium sp. M1E.F.Ca.ET.045.02.1.1 TaxID=2493672 RepID=UPI000F764423|nr:hypothetical protein [Mesorhizobium sp. M1E.F.Ca.ET.045.02.1.1]AZO24782.1 hypothetical protein EJ070_31695 [Mesorhizobium sp. M1E.F.Ca.ET.045.02.1.1]
MFAKSVKISSLTSLLLVATVAVAEEPVQVAQKTVTKIVAGDGPFEIKGEAALFGYVTAIKGPTATFQPCSGEKFDVDISELKRTKLNCGSEPPPDQAPLGVSCKNADELWGAFAPVLAQEKSTVGSTYVAAQNQVQPSDSVKAALADIRQIRNCNQSVVGVDSHGTTVMQIVPASEKLDVQAQ